MLKTQSQKTPPRTVTFTAVFALVFAGSLPDVALACKDWALEGFFPLDELARYDDVYVVRVQKVVPSSPPAVTWYAPPFTFEAKVLKSFKGPKKPGEIITGRTSSDEEPGARCSISLKAGGDYLLMLNRQDNPFILPRYGSPYVSSADQYFRRYFAQIEKFYANQAAH